MVTIIRTRFIQKTVFDFYKSLPEKFLTMPFDIFSASKTISNCRIISYQEFASMHNISVNDVMKYTESADGVTNYDPSTNRYIILYNDISVDGRMRFTIAHEVGHLLLGHLTMISSNTAAQNNLYGISDTVLEKEADLFASIVLCPFPVLKSIGVQKASEIKNLCGLSVQASLITAKQYLEWLNYHPKSAWENDVKKLFQNI